MDWSVSIRWPCATSAAAAPCGGSALSVQRAGVRQELDVEGALALRWNDVDLRVAAHRAPSCAGTLRYQFRLDGLESDWFDGGGRGERELGRLAPGRYAPHVRANAAGVWSAPYEPLRLVVATPPWLRWWAWLAYVLGLLLVLGLSLRAWRRRCSDAIPPWRSSGASWPSSPVRPSPPRAHGPRIPPMTGLLLGMTKPLL